jgi:hypothetical protein
MKIEKQTDVLKKIKTKIKDYLLNISYNLINKNLDIKKVLGDEIFISSNDYVWRTTTFNRAIEFTNNKIILILNRYDINLSRVELKFLIIKDAEEITHISVIIFAADDDDEAVFDSTEIIVCDFYKDGFHLVECEDGFDILLTILENNENNLKNIALCRY